MHRRCSRLLERKKALPHDRFSIMWPLPFNSIEFGAVRNRNADWHCQLRHGRDTVQTVTVCELATKSKNHILIRGLHSNRKAISLNLPDLLAFSLTVFLFRPASLWPEVAFCLNHVAILIHRKRFLLSRWRSIYSSDPKEILTCVVNDVLFSFNSDYGANNLVSLEQSRSTKCRNFLTGLPD